MPRPSLLDQLIDDDAPVVPRNRFEQEQRFEFTRLSILADVEKLLNTRPRCRRWPEKYSELNNSILDYGLEDFSGRDLASEADRDALCASVETTIARYEPRLTNIKTRLLPIQDEFDNAVRFRIDATVKSVAEAVLFQADLVTDTGRFQLTEEKP